MQQILLTYTAVAVWSYGLIPERRAFWDTSLQNAGITEGGRHVCPRRGFMFQYQGRCISQNSGARKCQHAQGSKAPFILRNKDQFCIQFIFKYVPGRTTFLREVGGPCMGFSVR